MMRRRSNAVPIRPSELFNFQDDGYTAAVSKASAVPRQLDFNSKPSRPSIVGRPHVLQRQRPRMSLVGRARNEDSVMEGVSLLNQTANSADVTIQVPKASVPSVSSGSVRSGPTSLFGKKSDILKPKVVPESSRGLLSKKTTGNLNKSQDKPKGSAEEESRRSAELNSTAAFENEEIAALTSTPHPDRKSKSVLPLSSAVENSELAEQMKLFVMDQRNLMQVVKLSFQKMNSVMDQMNSLMSKLNLEVDSQYELKLVKKSEPLPSCDSAAIINPIQSSKPESNSSETVLSNSVPNDDKENVDVKLENALSMYSDLKSQLKCLKTPTSLRTRPLSAETPNTVLSNAVHHQLENLYETVEVDE